MGYERDSPSDVRAPYTCVLVTGEFRRSCHREQTRTRRFPIHVFVTSCWFPPILALLQAARYLGFIGYDYWIAAQNEKRFDVGEFLRRDLARPLFEPYEFCGGWTHYSPAQSANFGLDLPAYVGATLLHSAVNFRGSCADALMTPRGQIITAPFVLALWFFVGLSV